MMMHARFETDLFLAATPSQLLEAGGCVDSVRAPSSGGEGEDALRHGCNRDGRAAAIDNTGGDAHPRGRKDNILAHLGGTDR